MIRFTLATTALLLSTSPAALAAQTHATQPSGAETPAPTPTPSASAQVVEGSGDIVVTGERERGGVIGDIQPEEQLGPADIRAYGVSSVSDLLTELAADTGSGMGSGRPVVLVNGRRISGFREIRDLPVEAIARVDILPEEVALKYGYRADQKVVNIVLREHFRATTAEVKDKVPTAGGNNDLQLEGHYLKLTPNGRLDVEVEGETQSRLLESQRGILPTSSGAPYALAGNITSPSGGAIDPALTALAGSPITVAGVIPTTGAPTLDDFSTTANPTDDTSARTLEPSKKRTSVNAVYATKVFGDVNATINLSLEGERDTSWQGWAGAQLLVPSDNPYSPFSNDVLLNRYADTSQPLTSTVGTLTGHAGVTLNGVLSRWQWTLTGAYDRVDTRTDTATGVDIGAVQQMLMLGDNSLNPFTPDFLTSGLGQYYDNARSVSDVGQLNALITGSPLTLPAGPVTTSFNLEFDDNQLHSNSTRSGVYQRIAVGRTVEAGQVNVDLPIANKSRAVLSTLGKLSLNGNAQVRQLSDFGTLTSLGYGLHWTPVDPVSLLVSVTQEDGEPTPQQLGNPTILTPNTRIFDYVTGQTVDVTQISGGNPNLIADNRHVMKIELNLNPLKDVRLNAQYVTERIRNPIESFPSATAQIEAAFPDRFVRGPDGQLVQVDSRPVNFEQSDRQQLRWGINFTKRLGGDERGRFGGRGGGGGGGWRRQNRQDAASSDRQSSLDPQAKSAQGGQTTQDGASGDKATKGADNSGNAQAQNQSAQNNRQAQRRGGRGGHRPFGGGGGRLRISLYHTIHLQDRILIRPGVAPLDLLNGAALGNSGGQPRHEVQLNAALFKNGFGGRLSADWQSATHVDGGTNGDDSLRFSDLATFNLRLFADLGRRQGLVARHSWLRGARISLSIDNIFDTRQHVTDAQGEVPLRYQPGYLDPLGRTISISLRKMFF
ncbi:TonB-dependent receptor plug domain-containing protein [Stakelama sediminis]|uniref:TonB-dependent receptor n=1 Tax=Stakelama sediminis TaxID=463200 RepID=A0A840Z1K8_9SPHN|nr:TonB-dependent receptor [Stakelama sediminis]MBB5719669.1 hypothetical protein [Stakelama sediminis]